jgi:plastocyanin
MLSRFAAVLGVWAVTLGVVAQATAVNQTVSALNTDLFSPTEVTITQGEQVTFQNSGGNHNVHFDDGSVDFPASPSTTAWKTNVILNQVGDFRFYCEQHGGPGGSGMSGIVHVVAPPPGGGPPEPEPGGGRNPGSGPGGPAPGGQGPGGGSGGGSGARITFKASDTTPLAGKRVRLFGVVTPAHDGAKLLIQKRLRNGKFKTIAKTRLHAAPGDKSTYSVKLRLAKDVVLRATVAGGKSKVRKLDVRAHPSTAAH